MRTIFITSFHPLISRNILSTPLFDFLLVDRELQIVLLVPEDKRGFFQKEFGRDRVIVETVPRAITRRDIFLRYLALSSVDTRALEVLRRAAFHTISARCMRIAGKRKIMQYFVRMLDALVTPRERFAKLLRAYRPALVFSTDMKNENDVRLVHDAQRKNVATVGMITLFTKSVTKSTKLGIVIGGILTILYGFIYALLQMEDFTLLIGSVGLFVILAIMMFVSRKINWYGGEEVAE